MITFAEKVATYLSLRKHPVINRSFPARREEDPQ